MSYEIDPSKHFSASFSSGDGSQPVASSSLRNPWDTSKPYQFGDLLGGLLYNISGTKAQNDYNSIEAERARVDNAKQAQLQRDWEQRMADTTYQRTVADMKAAGLNPALLSGLTVGSATSTGSGSASSGSAASSSSGTSNGIIGALALVIAALTKGKAKSK